jgi:hypothetical protein
MLVENRSVAGAYRPEDPSRQAVQQIADGLGERLRRRAPVHDEPPEAHDPPSPQAMQQRGVVRQVLTRDPAGAARSGAGAG